jgi:hypothetical protein
MLFGSEKATLIVGHFGSGKSEVSVNLALAALPVKSDVTLVDLDLVNPYFRSREAAALLEQAGVRVVLPEARYLDADLPILVPAVRSLLMAGSSYGVIDVGGDDVGARVLGALEDALVDAPVRVLMVLNHLRPFSDTVAGCLRMRDAIEASGKVRITGFVSNGHLMEDTTPTEILEGLALGLAVSREGGVPLEFVTAPEALAQELAPQLPVPVLAIRRNLLPPWLKDLPLASRRPKPLLGL